MKLYKAVKEERALSEIYNTIVRYISQSKQTWEKYIQLITFENIFGIKYYVKCRPECIFQNNTFRNNFVKLMECVNDNCLTVIYYYACQFVSFSFDII